MPTPLLVSAASSLTDVLPRIGQVWAKTTQQSAPRFNFGASGTLLKQIQAGAPVDVFASAALAEMDVLRKAKLLADAPVVFAGNNFVLIVPVSGVRVSIKTWGDLRGANVKRIAISNPETVPSGRVARDVLQHRGLWEVVQQKLVKGENVRQTLAYAARGDADAALVFATDARIEKARVRVVAEAEMNDVSAPIAYPAGVLARSSQKDAARSFARFLRTQPAQAILQSYGFVPPPLVN